MIYFLLLFFLQHLIQFLLFFVYWDSLAANNKNWLCLTKEKVFQEVCGVPKGRTQKGRQGMDWTGTRWLQGVLIAEIA